MKLKCRIHEKDYDIVAGATFADEYNETLDSGSIIIDQISKMKKLKPYDDVFIWDANQEFNGYVNVGDKVALSNFANIVHNEHTIIASGEEAIEVEDEYLSENMPSVFSTGIEFYSYRYLIDDVLYPSLIDIWASNFLYGLDLNSPCRWVIPDITFKLTLEHDVEENGETVHKVVHGCYKLPRYQTSGVTNTGLLVLTKNTSSAFASDNDDEAPNTLYFNYELRNPGLGTVGGIIVGGSSPSASIRLHMYAETISVPIDQATNDDIYLITACEKPTSISTYSYSCYPEVSSKLNFSLDTIKGLTKEQVLMIKDMKMYISAQGYSFYLKSKDAIEGEDNDIIFKFVPEWYEGWGGSTADEVKIILSKDENNDWSCSNAEFNFKLYEYLPDHSSVLANYPIDKIFKVDEESPYIYFDKISTTRTFLPTFYKHLLVDDLHNDMLSPTKEKNKRLYKYKISLMSETKRIEKIILPNMSITQPIVGQKRSVWYYLNQFVDMYSPKIKFKDSNNKWVYKNKYRIDARLAGDYDNSNKYIKIPVHEIFTDDIYAPEMSLSAPTLRELLSRLMIVKDCIPIVRDDVIYAMKISEVHGEFKINDDNFSFISESMNSANYSTSFRREYGGAISQKNTAHMVEFMGFRTAGAGDGLMTLDNMILQTRFPIYKINKLYVCYFKTVLVTRKNDNSSYTKLVLVKQDITKIVLQDTVRNTLATDWTAIAHDAWKYIDENQMSKYRIFTLGYSIGSNIISGWGEKISYIKDLLGWAYDTYAYIEIILDLLDRAHTWGVNGLQFLEDDEIISSASIGWRSMVSPNNSGNTTEKLKSLFFEMDYTAMYSGAIIHSKENTEDDDIQTPDNCSSALSILEVDGLFEREKANRLANTEYSFIARFDSVSEMEDANHNNIVGAKYEDDDDTAIIYHREYQIYDDCVLANFVGTHDYVLKNYFTTVFAKYRTYSYAGYDENINRAETDKYLIFLSDDRCYYEDDDNGLKQNVVTSVLSAFSESYISDDLNIEFPNQINGGYFGFHYSNGLNKEFYSDVNQFVSGYSLCFNIKTFDNMTNGNYIIKMNCYDDATNIWGGQKEYVGSQLEWHRMPVSETDGFISNIKCYFGHFENKDFYKDYIDWNNHTADQLYQKILSLPLKNIVATFAIGKEYNFCKDNKETIDFTLQYELVNQDNTLVASEWLMKLTDFSNYVKFSGPKFIENRSAEGIGFEAKYWSKRTNKWNLFALGYGTGGFEYEMGIKLIFSVASVEENNVLNAGTTFVGGNLKYETPYWQNTFYEIFSGFNTSGEDGWTSTAITLERILSVSRNGNNISHITVRLLLGPIKGGGNVSYSSSLVIGKVKEFDIDLQLVPRENDEPYEFVYTGQIAKDWFGDSKYAVIRNNDVILNEQNALSKQGSVTLESNPYTFPKTMYVLVSDKEVEQSLVYEQVKLADLPSSHLRIVETSDNVSGDGNSFSDVFGIEIDANGRPYIKYHAIDKIEDAAESFIDGEYKSVQYWYHDVEGDGYLHFVMGVNVDNAVKDKKIYISTLKNRNPIVYDYLHRECGEIMNFAESENEDKYGEQLFVPNDEEE